MQAVAVEEEAPAALQAEGPPMTIPGEILARCQTYGRRTYLRYWDGHGWHDLSWADFEDQALRIACALVGEGVKAGDRVLLISENRVEWLLCDLAIISAGAITVPVYPTSSLASMKVIVRTTEPVLGIASNTERADRLLAAGVAAVKLIEADIDSWRHRAPEAGEFDEVRRRLSKLSPDALATIIPTSGTTGEPKGVMLRHRNFTEMAHAALQVFDFGENDLVLSYLPYAHVLERVDGVFVETVAGCTLALGRGMDHLVEDIAELRPTAMLGVPRVFEKVYQRVMDLAAEEPAWKRRLLFWALAVGSGRAARDEVQPRGLRESLAERLVLRGLRERLTGGRLRFFVSGGAPLSQKVEEFFWALGVKILQGWGLTESTSGATSNTETQHRYRTVGKPLPGIELRIADDGEILVRGPAVMAGYFADPKASAATLDEEWLRTGDIGFVDGEGYLTITDRKKDLIKTAGGKYIAPQPIEASLMADRCVAAAMVVGDGRPYAVALIVPDWAALAAAKGFTGEPADLAEDPEVRAVFAGTVEAANRDLAGFETIKRFALLPRDFTEEAGELTPTLKPKRRVVLEHYAQLVDELYAQAREAVPA